jgi:hypothetical protein
MKVQFKTNLGSTDAEQLGLSFLDCLGGAVVDVSQQAGDELCRRGMATPVAEPEPKKHSPKESAKESAEFNEAASIRAVPPVPIAEVKSFDMKTSEPAAKPKGDK